jgi:hypothetical protein
VQGKAAKKVAREDEEPLDAKDIRKILLACDIRRLKAYLLVLASGGIYGQTRRPFTIGSYPPWPIVLVLIEEPLQAFV